MEATDDFVVDIGSESDFHCERESLLCQLPGVLLMIFPSSCISLTGTKGWCELAPWLVLVLLGYVPYLAALEPAVYVVQELLLDDGCSHVAMKL